MTTEKKHQEFILAVHRDYFGKLLVDGQFVEENGETFRQVIPFDFKEFSQDALPHLIISQRLGLETDSRYRQLLPYFLVTKLDADNVKRYAKYARAKGSGESRLLGGTSIGFGGHIEHDDILPVFLQIETGTESELHPVSGSIDLYETILNSQEREADEELKYTNNLYPGISAASILENVTPTLLILSKDQKVGQYHVGLVSETEIFPTDELTSGEEGAIAFQGWFTIEELLADPKLENWSRLVLEYKISKYSEDEAQLFANDAVSFAQTTIDELKTAPSFGQVLSGLGFASTDAGDRIDALEGKQIFSVDSPQSFVETVSTAVAESTAELHAWVESKISERAFNLAQNNQERVAEIDVELKAKHVTLTGNDTGVLWKTETQTTSDTSTSLS